MRVPHNLVAIIALAFTVCFSPGLFAQDMDTQEGIYRQQYEQYTARQSALQQQIDGLSSVLTQIQTLIDQVNALPADNFAQQADKYGELQLLLPSAEKFSQEISQRQRQLDKVTQQIDELRTAILARQSSLPIWWKE